MIRARRRLLVQVLTVALVGAALALGPQPGFATEYEMVVDTVTVDLHRVEAGGPGGAESSRPREVGGDTDVAPFTMIGATYASEATRPGRVRVLVDGSWSRWFPLVGVGPDADHGPDAGTGEGNRPASDPIWVGGGQGYELSLPADATGVSVHLVREAEDRVIVDGTEGASGYTVPNVRPRSAWGAAPYRGTVDTANGLVRAVIHHTVNGNGYSAAQVPSMLRSIQAYHQNSRGWDDIGYNFVVDRFGTVWEGRARSLYEPVIGAHAQDFNTRSVGVAYLGDGSSTGLTPTAVANLGRFLGWKMALHGARPTQANIVGHRDVGQTACPGNAVYNQLGAIRRRAIAQAPPAGPFFDVPDSSARAPHLRWALNRSIIEPLEDGTFLPERRVTRADAVYWLWRYAGRPGAGAPHGFSDVPANAYYRDALRWARQQEIVSASPDGLFRPAQPLNRERYVVQLWRFAGEPDVAVDHGYSDVPPGVGSTLALDWSWDVRLVNTAAFGRNQIMTRDEAVRLLYRYSRFV